MAEGSPNTETLARLCGFLIGAGKAVGLSDIATSCAVSEDEVWTLMATAKERLASVGLCLLTEDNGRSFVALDVASRTAVGKLNGESAGRKQISPEAAEILALIREKGRLTVKEMHRIRGTNPRNTLETLLNLGLVRRAGRAVGRGGAWLYQAAADPSIVSQAA